MIPILLVDDQPANLLALEVTLRNPEYELIKAHSGAEALEWLEKKNFALILLDVQMPGMDGFDTIQKIKQNPKFNSIPVIFLTAIFLDEPLVEKAHRLGAVDFVLKPFNIEILKSKVSLFTELFSSRMKIQQQAREFDAALSSGPDHHYIFDLNHRFLYANKSLLTLWGKTLDEVKGKNFKDLGYPQELIELHEKQLDQVITSKRVVRAESSYQNFQGNFGLYEYILSPVLGEDGNIEAIAGTGRDISERRRQEISNNEKALLNERDNFVNLFRQTPEMVCILKGPAHVFEFVNEAHIKVLGFDATGMAVRIAQPESVEVHGILDNVYNTGVTAELHEIPVTVTDRLRYFNLTYSARRDVDGKINGVMILGLEVTDVVEARLALRESQEQLNFALAGSNMGVWSVNLETGKVDLSREAAVIFDAEENFQSADLAIDSFIHPEDREHAREKFIQALGQDTMYSDEYRVLKRDGSISWVSLRGRALYTDGKPKLLAGIVMDVSERRAQELELERAISMRDEFISIASHELRTPITTLSLQNQMLLRVIEKNNEDLVDANKVRRVVDTSLIQLKHLIRLVDDMLDVSRITAHKIELHLQDVNFADIVREGLTRFMGVFEEKNIKLNLKLEGRLHIELDTLRIDQIITNLVSNAIKYGDNKPITIELKEDAGFAVFSVTDEGLGIAKDKLPKIFDRFERAISAQNISGWGLGLYIVKGIVEAHHGTIEVFSELGKGSKFVVRLPITHGHT